MSHVEKCSNCAGTGKVVLLGTGTSPSPSIPCLTCGPWGSQGYVMVSDGDDVKADLAAEVAAHAVTQAELVRLQTVGVTDVIALRSKNAELARLQAIVDRLNDSEREVKA